MENRFMYFAQLGILKQLLSEEIITQNEYATINNYIKSKYQIKELHV